MAISRSLASFILKPRRITTFRVGAGNAPLYATGRAVVKQILIDGAVSAGCSRTRQ